MNNGCWHLAKQYLAVAVLVTTTAAAEPGTEPEVYLRTIKPILKARCYACHGSLKQESGLRLDSGSMIRKGGDNGAVIVPGKSDGRLLGRIRSIDVNQRMPPEGEPLDTAQIARIASWIEEGAPFPDDERPEADPRSHWSIQQPVRPEIQLDANTQRFSNPVDALIARERTLHNLIPQSPASKQVLLRRISLDLIGLPPTREELQSFLADDSPDAYDKVVERLLDSPQYGERWGRHWMDIWRYSDWYGRRYVPDVWNSAPQIWRWRDWIVNSLNQDKGYDQMVAQMLAADEIAPEEFEAGYATGYLIRNWYALNPNDWMRSNVEHTGKAFLGLTFNCAHCHDHKYDPISQDDYFRLRAFFEPISIRQDRVAGEPDPGPFQEYSYSVLRKIVRLGGIRIFDKTPDAPTWFYTGGDERNRVPDRGSISAGVPAFLADSAPDIHPVSLPSRAWYPALRPAIQQTILAEKRAAIAKLDAEIPAVRAVAETALPPLQAKLNAAEAEYAQAMAAAENERRALALAGRQSLLLDATAGRRVLLQGLRNVKSLPDGSAISFQLRILKDAYLNFQLAKDLSNGLTAAYVGFDQGRVMSYRPGSFEEFEVCKYSFPAGQNRFEVTFVLDEGKDRCLLSVRSLSDNTTLVENVPVARNGWNPVGDDTKGIFIDVRTGGVAAFDDLLVAGPPSDLATATDSAPTGSRAKLAFFDFESPLYQTGRDVHGVDGWLCSSFSQSPATSVISAAIGDDSISQSLQNVVVARRAVEVQSLPLKSIEAKHACAVADFEAANACIAADNARYGEMPTVDAKPLIQIASQLSRQVSICNAEAEVAAKEQLLAVAETKPPGDPNRSKEIDAAAGQLTASLEQLQKLRAAVADPAQPASYAALSPMYPQTSTGRRRALAQWIASNKNPLTARVAVNHIWTRHFHSPLVSTVYDFGRNGSLPTHPALLDWLAVELMENGWSMKHLHRIIVGSDVYRMSSSSSEGTASQMKAIDPENRFLWRMNAGRMEAEVVRDSLLHCAGDLDLRMGGQELENAQALVTRRRTLYYSCNPESDGKSTLGALFDAPEPAECYRRTSSIIPQQALALTNSDLIHELSGKLSASLWQSLTAEQQMSPSTWIDVAFEQILTRRPTDTEQESCLQFLASSAQDDAIQIRARESLVRVILNHNDFIAIR